MGAEDTNFHAGIYRRMGYSEVVDEVTRLFRSFRRISRLRWKPGQAIWGYPKVMADLRD